MRAQAVSAVIVARSLDLVDDELVHCIFLANFEGILIHVFKTETILEEDSDQEDSAT